MADCKSFSPKINSNCKVLILGSMPGIKSLEAQEYYAHPQNRFWKVLGVICNCENLHNLKYDEKIEILLANGFALWDTIKFCKREGSLDSAIIEEKPNDIRGLLKKYPDIKTVCLNGNKSFDTFKKNFPDLIMKYNCIKMPSTSPANAKFRIDNLISEWKKIK